MSRRQTMTKQWLIIADQPDWAAISRLPRGSGILVLRNLKPSENRQLRCAVKLRSLDIAYESAGDAARVHSMRELTGALLRRDPLILVSPIFPTPTHPDWAPLPRMRAATLARLTGHRAIALGGMSKQRYAKIAPLGFIGWAGISTFRT